RNSRTRAEYRAVMQSVRRKLDITASYNKLSGAPSPPQYAPALPATRPALFSPELLPGCRYDSNKLFLVVAAHVQISPAIGLQSHRTRPYISVLRKKARKKVGDIFGRS